MSETLFINPGKAAQMLIDSGIDQETAFEHLIRLKDTEFCIRYGGTSYFDPRELEKIILAA